MRAFAEDLELPLTLGHFSVDAFVVNSGVKTEIEVFLNDGAGDAAHVFVADATIVWALRSDGMAVFGEAERTAVLIEKVFLLKSEPDIRVVLGGGTHVGGMRGAIGVHDLAQNQITVLLGCIGIESHRL